MSQSGWVYAWQNSEEQKDVQYDFSDRLKSNPAGRKTGLPLYAKTFVPPGSQPPEFRNVSTVTSGLTGPVENQGHTYCLEDDPNHTSFDVPVWIRIANRRQI